MPPTWRERRRLACDGSVPDEFPPKPKGMHWRSYNQLLRAIVGIGQQIFGLHAQVAPIILGVRALDTLLGPRAPFREHGIGATLVGRSDRALAHLAFIAQLFKLAGRRGHSNSTHDFQSSSPTKTM